VASIARRFNVSPAQVAEWNNVGATAAFRAGQAVTVYLPARSGKAAPRAQGPRAAAAPRPRAATVQKQKRR